MHWLSLYAWSALRDKATGRLSAWQLARILLAHRYKHVPMLRLAVFIHAWRRYFAYIARQLAKNLTWGTDECALPMTPPRLVALIRHAMPEDGIVCLDNGLYKVRLIWQVSHEVASHA